MRTSMTPNTDTFYVVQVACIFNWGLERQNRKKVQTTSDNCIGSFAHDVPNNSGQHPVDFCAINNLFISKTFFQRKAAHITTLKNKRVYPKDKTKNSVYSNRLHTLQ